MALIPCLYIGRSRAASSFSMPGSEAIFHGFVCAPSHQVELSLPASFMYSSLHCLYEVETTIHFRGWEVKRGFVMGSGVYEPYMILSHCDINDFVPHLI